MMWLRNGQGIPMRGPLRNIGASIEDRSPGCAGQNLPNGAFEFSNGMSRKVGRCLKPKVLLHEAVGLNEEGRGALSNLA